MLFKKHSRRYFTLSMKSASRNIYVDAHTYVYVMDFEIQFSQK